ncbi:hypothetical protein QYE76_057344 [Lolium multiflorum]|uniref:Uncharacterized protein n=1 Tax=Lolium multiflorum TaxID=4521 RepID=A0AAD8T491_LOLMU|nr:hypothetical protein QYE76_057344 [Lolium multiflorum]
MAFSDDDGAANNGFPAAPRVRGTSSKAGYPARTRGRPAAGAGRGRRANPAAASGDLLDIEIEEARMKMTDEERAEPRHHPDNYTAWNSYFAPRRELAAHDARRLRLRATTRRAANVGGARRAGASRPSSSTSKAATSRC